MAKLMKIKACLTIASMCLFLSACAAPPAIQIISLAADGISYLATDKTITDHGISALTQKDCKMMRTLKGEEICQEELDVLDDLEENDDFPEDVNITAAALDEPTE